MATPHFRVICTSKRVGLPRTNANLIVSVIEDPISISVPDNQKITGLGRIEKGGVNRGREPKIIPWLPLPIDVGDLAQGA